MMKGTQPPGLGLCPRTVARHSFWQVCSGSDWRREASRRSKASGGGLALRMVERTGRVAVDRKA